MERDRSIEKTNRIFQRLMGGVAYRPVDNNKLNMLAKYDYSRDVNHSSANDLTDYAKQVGQIEAVYDWTKKTELYGKYALKFAAENITDITTYSLTDLITARIRYKFTDTLDVAGLYHVINGRAVNAIKQGAQAEIGVTLYGHVRIAGGWTFTDYTDTDVSSDSYLGTGPYVRASLALLDPDLESIPGVKSLVQDRSDAERERLIKNRVNAMAREETLKLNEKFRYAELLYSQGKYTEARAAYEEVALRMTGIESDVDSELKSRIDAEEAIVARFDEAQALFAAGKFAEARALFEQVAKR
jgi:tetratricopeptide (TPR) repeat protein